MAHRTKIVIISVFVVAAVMMIGIVSNIHQFLSAKTPVDPEILIFESWIYNIDNSVKEAVKEFQRGKYKCIIVTGFNQDSDDPINEGGNPIKAKEALVEGGVDPNKIYTVTVPQVQRHRTFSMALGCRIWIESNDITGKNINVFTFGPHARKSEVVFKQVLEPYYKVGVISAKPIHYNPKFWWCSKMGFKWVFYDSLKYLLALVCY